MSPMNTDQLEQKKQERKVQIMRAALKVFADNGIKLTKMNMIAKEAKISYGLVYHYFESKEQVLYESLEWGMERNKTKEMFDELNKKQLSALEKIKSFMMVAFKEGDTGRTGDVFRIIQHLHSSPDLPTHIHELIEQSGKVYIETLYPLFMEGQESGEIIEGNAEELLRMYLTILSGIMAEDPLFWKENTEWKVSILIRMIAA
ncbi:TetR/AcrR family transcriptional regulator [Bacillus horti]|uniref:AcrR family transcriptional regulator n=1 Tax=Caldalkalibacillus horti TaxID=77523 RepID=A0ABT9VW46_9BACI|nr:TetR/AcrR family transcriptional regulator [Bacillus horti]MDQ0165110.1 AcrR family transcriptional regulator [Bacillus horti]